MTINKRENRPVNRSAVLSFIVYIAAIIAANIATAHLGLVPVGFGLVVTAGTFAAGFALLARDVVHRHGGAWLALAGITFGAGLSLWLVPPALALASLVAFTVAELADLLVYARLRRRGFVRAAAVSNVIAAPLDTVLFLWLADPVLEGPTLTAHAVAGQLVAKLVIATAIPLALYVAARRRRPVAAAVPAAVGA